MKRTKKELLNGISKEVRKSQIIANNTLRIDYADNSQAIRLHNTDVITFNPDNSITLNSGGWRTLTTKDRISSYSTLRTRQDKGLWYVNGFLFYDGITFSKDGKLLSKEQKPNLDKVAKLKLKISKFVGKLSENNLPMPSSGDCWLCSFKDKNGTTWGEQRGDNNDHLLQHVKEGYLHGSLLVNAMLEAGYTRPGQIGLFYHMKMVDAFKRSLRKYLQKRLIKDIAVK